MPAPDPGKLNQQITIQQRTTTQDTEGGMIDSWSDVYAGIWAAKNNLSGNERASTKHGGIVADERCEFTAYYAPDVTSAMRILHNGTHYNIRHVNNFMERNEYLIITCDTGGNHGR